MHRYISIVEKVPGGGCSGTLQQFYLNAEPGQKGRLPALTLFCLVDSDWELVLVSSILEGSAARTTFGTRLLPF